MKRTLRRHEWQTVGDNILITPHTVLPERWKNDAAILAYLREKTNIPLPRLQCVYEDDGAFHHCTEYVEGVSMMDLSEEDKVVVKKGLQQHVETLKALRSDTPGVPGRDLLCPPLRVPSVKWKVNSCWRPRQDVKGNYIFFHNDLGQHNIIVDPKTLKINAIIDWEYGGFWPEWFEQPFWKVSRPSELEGHREDVEKCQQWLLDHCDEVEIPHISIPGHEQEKP